MSRISRSQWPTLHWSLGADYQVDFIESFVLALGSMVTCTFKKQIGEGGNENGSIIEVRVTDTGGALSAQVTVLCSQISL